MTEHSRLIVDYARRQPHQFAASIAHASHDEISTILEGLPNEIAASAVCSLPVSIIRDLFSDSRRDRSPWLLEGSTSHAMGMLISLPKDQRSQLVNALPAGARRRALQRFLNYPVHSVGTIVSQEFIVASADRSTKDVIGELKREALDRIVIVIDDADHYVGIMDPQRVLAGDSESPVSTFTDRVEPLLAEIPVDEASGLDQWSQHTTLPVVDHQQRVLGTVSRQELLAAAAEMRPPVAPIHEVLAEMSSLYIGVLTQLLSGIVRGPRGTP